MGTATHERFEIQIGKERVTVTHPEKILWPQSGIRKVEYLQYLIGVAPHMLPFLRERALTVVRYPSGIGKKEKSFYQKNAPDHTPEFVRTAPMDGNEHIICSDLETLVWLGNQSAIEFHVPFNTIRIERPEEIVFDLDPPARKEFRLAIEAARLLKEMFDKLGLISYIKTSGNKGLQIYLPLPSGRYSYEETRRFTSFFANYLVAKEPGWFTTERMKANRGNKLYVDYVQHARGKTIIAPFSLRGNEQALVAAPLFWEEVTDTLSPEQFPLGSIQERLAKKGNPFAGFHQDKERQRLEPVMDWIPLSVQDRR